MSSVPTDGTPPGTPNRRALAIAGDDADANATVTHLLDQFGFDALDVGPLAAGWRFQRDTAAYLAGRQNLAQLQANLADVRRSRDM